jgi:alkylation response protein AidB-like acyl-CoA dehydrogenase
MPDSMTDTRAVLSVAEAAPLAGRYAERADADGVLHPTVARALVTAGFARHFVPGRWGGGDGSVVELLDATSQVGAGCTAAAWCGALAAGAARMGAYLPLDGQADLWADSPDVFVAGALIPTGTATAAPGGWRLTGEWPFTSGVDHADWALVAAAVGSDGAARPMFFAVPRADFTVAVTWSSVGMRGTGSNTLVLGDAFVPARRAFDREAMALGRPVASSSPCHTIPLRAVSGVLFAAPALGAARGALAAWSQWIGELLETVPPEAAHAWRQVAARSAGEIDAAALLLHRVARVCDRGGLDPTEAVRNPYDCALAVDLLVGAVDRLYRSAGSRGQSPTLPLQRFWRDVHGLSTHTALRIEPAGAAYGSLLLDHRGRQTREGDSL